MQATQSHTNINTDRWHKASYSSTGNDCVEVCEGAVTGMRDTQNRELGHLAFTASEWAGLIKTL